MPCFTAGRYFSFLGISTLNTEHPPRRVTPMSQTATDYPVPLVDSDAPLSELHTCASERLNAALAYLPAPVGLLQRV